MGKTEEHESRLGLLPGVLIGSKYELVGLLGCGAMGEIWKARHVTLHETVAVKLVGATADHQDAVELASRFHLEARIAARLSRKSRHIVSVTDHGIEQGSEDAIAYLVMEELLGESLDTRLDRVGAMPVADVISIVTQIARGLSVAHAEGVIHRDLKPGNVFLVRDDGGQDLVKILDFGIAKFRAANDEPTHLVDHETQRGLLLGTLPYVSPEQGRGWASIDHRADVWSLAVMTYLLLTNEYPFGGASPSDLLLRIFSGDYVPILERRDLPPMFTDLFARAFHEHLDLRFQSAQAFANALAQSATVAARTDPRPALDWTTLDSELPGESRQPAPNARPRRAARRVAFAVAGALLVAGTSAVLLYGSSPSERSHARRGDSNDRDDGPRRTIDAPPAMTDVPPPTALGTRGDVVLPAVTSSVAAPSARPVRRAPATTRPVKPADRSEIF